MDSAAKKDIDAILADGREIDEAVKRAMREAVLRHKLLGNPVAELRDGKVHWVQPEDIHLPEE